MTEHYKERERERERKEAKYKYTTMKTKLELKKLAPSMSWNLSVVFSISLATALSGYAMSTLLMRFESHVPQ